MIGVEPDPSGNACAGAGAECSATDLARWLGERRTAAALEHVAAGIAQEFNRLLATLIGASDLLSEVDSDGGRDALAEVDDLIESVRDGADLSRLLHVLARGKVTPPRVVDPNAVLTTVARLLGRVIGEEVELVTEATPACWAVVADPGQLALALINLADNAREAMPQGGTLRLRTENVVVLDGDGPRNTTDVRTGEYAAFLVGDTGAGIPRADLPRIFDPLFTTRSSERNRGLGLATVAGIVRRCGGYVSVESTPGEGSTFTMLLPRSRKSEPLARRDASRDELILVVEEDGAVRLSVKRALEHLGYRVRAAATRAEAIDLLKTSGVRVHLVISDVVLPELHRQVLGKVVDDADDGPLLLYTSGCPDVDTLAHELADPAIALLRKPFSVYSLSEAVRERLDGRR